MKRSHGMVTCQLHSRNLTTYEVKASNVAMLSQPAFVLDVIRDAAKAVQMSAQASGVA